MAKIAGMILEKIYFDLKNYVEYCGISGLAVLRVTLSRYFYVILLVRLQGAKGAIFFPLRAIAKIILSFVYNIEVASKCDIGKGLILPHPRNIVIGARSIGDNCLIMANVTIGARLPDPGFNGKLRPRIGNDVFIGVGACVLGGISIGDFTSIGANAVVTKTTTTGAKVVGGNRIL